MTTARAAWLHVGPAVLARRWILFEDFCMHDYWHRNPIYVELPNFNTVTIFIVLRVALRWRATDSLQVPGLDVLPARAVHFPGPLKHRPVRLDSEKDESTTTTKKKKNKLSFGLIESLYFSLFSFFFLFYHFPSLTYLACNNKPRSL